MSQQQTHHEHSAENTRPYSHSGAQSRSYPGSQTGENNMLEPSCDKFVGTVLIVDDDPFNSEPLEAILSENGYRVYTAANGVDGLERMDEVMPELVILDFMMPLMNGAEMGRRLRANQATQNIPIVMNSGTSEDMVRQNFTGYDAFLRKPYRIDELLSVVSNLLKTSADRR
ncbi:response regulator [uncultured Nevskia sp.]|uniref:response regulator n=1 Tax=uncultured Nevskia sp. TaxID=228950 RepID=UPI0025D1CEE9|nr:response regulator [uncultured Nevskia sp.]